MYDPRVSFYWARQFNTTESEETQAKDIIIKTLMFNLAIAKNSNGSIYHS